MEIGPLVEKCHRLIEVISRVQVDSSEFKTNIDICDSLKGALTQIIEPIERMKGVMLSRETNDLILETKQILDKLIEFILYYDKIVKPHKSSNILDPEHIYDRLSRFRLDYDDFVNKLTDE